MLRVYDLVEKIKMFENGLFWQKNLYWLKIVYYRFIFGVTMRLKVTKRHDVASKICCYKGIVYTIFLKNTIFKGAICQFWKFKLMVAFGN
jgi:hypothetical protein